MELRYRPMQRKDVRECVRIIATHPVIGVRYGRAIEGLGRAWLRWLGCEGMRASVIEEIEGDRRTICFVGVSLFVKDDFLRELKTPPLVWIGPELVKRAGRGSFPVLSDEELRAANSRGGLNLLTWEGCVAAEFEKRTEIYPIIMRAFIEEHRGYLWKELVAAQIESAGRLQWQIQAGGLLWDAAKAAYVNCLPGNPEQIVAEPHILGVTREMELQRPGSWAGTLFNHQPARCGFSGQEQKLLRATLEGATDEELSDALGLSLPTVKKMWASVYRRAGCIPALAPDDSPAGLCPPVRGKEKRRRLLAYLREHPEELRPVSRRLLRQS